MRKAVIETLSTLADRDERIVLLTGDLGFMALEPFAERHPGRFFNVGVAEQNMIGVSTGLAEAGFIPFVYSIATFATLRPYEFIRNGPILHRLPVRILGIGGGFEYGSAGPTHYALEDIAVMRAQPGISVMAPVDHAQARSILSATWDMPGPIYYRVGKNDSWLAPGLHGAFELGRVQWLREGADLILLTLGPMAGEALAAAARLEADGRSCAVAAVASVRPVPIDDLRDIVSRFRAAVTVEAHYVDGGLGSLVAETAAASGSGCRVVRCGVEQTPDGRSGSDAWMRAVHGLTAEGIAAAALAALA